MDLVDALSEGINILMTENSVAVVPIPLQDMMKNGETYFYKVVLETRSEMDEGNTVMHDILYNFLASVPFASEDGRLRNFGSYAKISDLMEKDNIRLYAVTQLFLDDFYAGKISPKQILRLHSIKVDLKVKPKIYLF